MPKITFTYLPPGKAKGEIRRSQKKGSPIIALQAMRESETTQRMGA